MEQSIGKEREKKENNLTIMFVDDDHDMVNVMKTMLNNLGYQALCFTNSLEAFRSFSRSADDIDCAIVDMVMPQLDGMELAEMIKEIRADMPVILVSGFRERINHMQMQAIGITECLAKPLKRDVLAAAIRTATGQAE